MSGILPKATAEPADAAAAAAAAPSGVFARVREERDRKEKRQGRALSREMRNLAEDRRGAASSIARRFVAREKGSTDGLQDDDADGDLPPPLAPRRPMTIQSQSQRGQLAQNRMLPVCRWVWRPYRNSARDDNALFCRWERLDAQQLAGSGTRNRRGFRNKQNKPARAGNSSTAQRTANSAPEMPGADGAQADYSWAQLDRRIVLPRFTDAEYDNHIRMISRESVDETVPAGEAELAQVLFGDRVWTRDLTDELWELCERYEFRWPVIHDRFSDPKFSIDDLKARFYFVYRRVLELRVGPGLSSKPSESIAAGLPSLMPQRTSSSGGTESEAAAAQRQALMEFAFDLQKARERRSMAEIQYRRTREEIEEEAILLPKLREIEAILGRHERLRAKAVAATNIALSGYRGLTPLDAVGEEIEPEEEGDDSKKSKSKSKSKSKAGKKSKSKRAATQRQLTPGQSTNVLAAAAEIASAYGLTTGAPTDDSDESAVTSAATDLANLPAHSRPAHIPQPSGVGPHLRSAQYRPTWPTLPGGSHVSHSGAASGLAGAADRLLVDLGVCTVNAIDPHAPVLVGGPQRVSPAVPTGEVLSVMSELRSDVAVLVRLHDHLREQDYALRLLRSQLKQKQPEEMPTGIDIVEAAASEKAAGERTASEKADTERTRRAAAGGAAADASASGASSGTVSGGSAPKKRRRSGGSGTSSKQESSSKSSRKRKRSKSETS